MATNEGMMRTNRFMGFLWLIFVLALIAIIMAWIGFDTHGKDAREHLGQLGDYFGGVLNPVFAFFGFIALLFTIALQAQELAATREELKVSGTALEGQLRHFRTEAKKADIYKLIVIIQSEIEKALDGTVELRCDDTLRPTICPTLRALCNLTPYSDKYLPSAVNNEDPGIIPIRKLANLFEEMAHYLNEYWENSDEKYIVRYFSNRYMGRVVALARKQYLPGNTMSSYISRSNAVQ